MVANFATILIGLWLAYRAIFSLPPGEVNHTELVVAGVALILLALWARRTDFQNEITVAELPQIAAQVSGFSVRVPPIPQRFVSAPVERAPETVRIEVRDPNVLKLLDEHGDVRDIEELEADIIRFAKAHYRGHLTEVARKLEIGRSTLYRKLKQYGLDDGSPPPDVSDADAA